MIMETLGLNNQDISAAGTFSDTKTMGRCTGDSINGKRTGNYDKKNQKSQALRRCVGGRRTADQNHCCCSGRGMVLHDYPTFNWDFVDLDEDDYQTAFQVDKKSI